MQESTKCLQSTKQNDNQTKTKPKGKKMNTRKQSITKRAQIEATDVVIEYLGGILNQGDALNILGHSGVQAVDSLALVNADLLIQAINKAQSEENHRMAEHCIAAHTKQQMEEKRPGLAELISFLAKAKPAPAIPDGFFYAGEHETRGPLYLAADKVTGFAVNEEDHGSVVIILDCGTQVETYLTLEEVCQAITEA